MARNTNNNTEIDKAPAWKIAVGICTFLGIGFSAGVSITVNLYESKIERLKSEHNMEIQIERNKYKDFIIEQKNLEIEKLSKFINDEKQANK